MTTNSFIHSTNAYLLKRAFCQVVLGIEEIRTSVSGRIFQSQVIELS